MTFDRLSVNAFWLLSTPTDLGWMAGGLRQVMVFILTMEEQHSSTQKNSSNYLFTVFFDVNELCSESSFFLEKNHSLSVKN